MELKKGTKLTSMYKMEVVVDKQLGEGGQGIVYQVGYGGKPKALKMYKPGSLNEPKAFFDNLKNNILKGAPCDTFLWPQDIVFIDQNTFGYIMDLRPKGYQELSAFMTRAAIYASFKSAVDAALQIVSAFRILHSKGYSYQDLNDGNFFIDPRSGKALICDNDNVAPNNTHTGILGKPRYMAPEIVREEAMPNTNTDRFSLAVIIFIILTNCHPLEGVRYLVPCLTPEVELKIYGTDPIFICDPNNRNNAPSRDVHKNIGIVWPEFPKYLRDAFVRSFTVGLKDPNRRLTEQEWEALLIHFRSDIIPCRCGNENFTWDEQKPCCGRCKRLLGPFKKLKMTGCDYPLPLLPESVVFRRQLGTANVDEAGKAIIRVIMNPKDKSLYMQNTSGKEMECVTPTGRRVPVAHSEVVPANPGIGLRLEGGMVTVLENDC